MHLFWVNVHVYALKFWSKHSSLPPNWSLEVAVHKLESIKEVAINILEWSEFRSSSDDTSQITDTPGLKPFTMLDNILWSLNSVQHPKIFLLFPSLINNVWFVWTVCKTVWFMHTHTRLSPGKFQSQNPYRLVITLFYKTCFTLLDSFDQPIKQSPTLFYKTILDDVLWCFTCLDRPYNGKEQN